MNSGHLEFLEEMAHLFTIENETDQGLKNIYNALMLFREQKISF